ncbi:uncharacterized protein A4U43_C10F5810 [Asparagus officinalis]|uniref:Uncharacterized protein n=1 Tax=Asparagus officinalis TaxID=4686 RepID=A0A5P1E113_ASPOF|nr:uncharacterized protein A4U43_C10F5810 [Asparagus officinalis]
MAAAALFHLCSSIAEDKVTKLPGQPQGPVVLQLGLGHFQRMGLLDPVGNSKANMLYLETPAGVGFSYSSNDSYYAGVDDKMILQKPICCIWRHQQELGSLTPLMTPIMLGSRSGGEALQRGEIAATGEVCCRDERSREEWGMGLARDVRDGGRGRDGVRPGDVLDARVEGHT